MKTRLKILFVTLGAILIIASLLIQIYISLKMFDCVLIYRFVFIEHWSKYTFIAGVITFGTSLCFCYK